MILLATGSEREVCSREVLNYRINVNSHSGRMRSYLVGLYAYFSMDLQSHPYFAYVSRDCSEEPTLSGSVPKYHLLDLLELS